MARDDGEQQAMTSERLAHWHWVIAKHFEPQSMRSVVIDVRDLAAFVAEVERLRAREAALVAVVRAVAEAGVGSEYSGGTWLLFSGYEAEAVRDTARAWLASTDDEGSGSDGQQPEQATCPVCGTPGRRVTSRWWCDGCNLPFRRPGEAAGEE